MQYCGTLLLQRPYMSIVRAMSRPTVGFAVNPIWTGCLLPCQTGQPVRTACHSGWQHLLWCRHSL